VTRYAIGDVQGCGRELRELLKAVEFSADRDRLWFVGDLVNRGPESLDTLRLVHALRDNAVVVLGNHDLHLLALTLGADRQRRSDTLAEVLAAPERDTLLEWLATRPLAHAEGDDLMVHAGVVPQWSGSLTVQLGAEVSRALASDAAGLFAHMYADDPDQWDERLTGYARLRFIINTLTRMRLCTADGRIDLERKGPPPKTPGRLRPWFEHRGRETRDLRVIFGHWSALGLYLHNGVVGLDSGCAWGGTLTAFDLDRERVPIAVPCAQYQKIKD
jgi:bis(5'-nucleosyl)-tetraphosphatase (symmetrical)